MNGTEARDAALAEDLDYAALEFRCGLEIHQQLDTGKLFCRCPSRVVDPDDVRRLARVVLDRRLRATQSEMGDLDVAAVQEAARDRKFRYVDLEGLSCLVEADEEPPHRIDDQALDVTLTLAGLVGARPADEVHVMRKTVIDGSNTSGFQRTALAATGGQLDVDGGDVSVWTIAVEEDSARKWEESQGRVTYTLDRLGIPLIEIATGPDIIDPDHAQRTAARIGGLLRATGRVKRGLGTIRQDLNVSVAVGDRVEIKGCQDLRAVPGVIEGEVRRQLWLHFVREELKGRGWDGTCRDPADVTRHVQSAESKIVQSAIKRGAVVLALPLQKWAGLIQGATPEGPRLGREFADHAKQAAGVKGVFHSDELPAYGIGEKEVAATRRALGLGDEDAFVLCVEKAATARKALLAVADRAAAALGPPPREVRATQPDDSTRYMRPLAGAARMYPETDIPPARIDEAHWARVLEGLPERPEVTRRRLQDDYRVSEDVAAQLVREGEHLEFEGLVKGGADASVASRTLLQVLPATTRQEALRARLGEVFSALAAGRFAKEAIPQVLSALEGEPGLSIDAAIAAAGAQALGNDEVVAVVDRVLAQRMDFVRQRGLGAVGPLMGPVMAELRGRADGKVVSDALKRAIEDALAA